MATTAEDIRAELEKKAGQRINPLLKGLSMLTGGIAGELTGTNEQMRERRQAKAALLEEQQRTMQEERMLSRIEANRKLALEEELKRIAAQDEAIIGRQRKFEEARAEQQRPEMMGYLRSRSGYNLGEPDIGTLQEMYSFEKAKQMQEEEAKKTKAGYTQVNVPGFGTIGGSPEQISAIAEKYPQVKKFISGEMETEPKYNTNWFRDPLTGQPDVRIAFKPGTPLDEQRKIAEGLFGQSAGFGGFPNPPAPGTPSNKKQEETPTSIPGYNVRMVK